MLAHGGRKQVECAASHSYVISSGAHSAHRHAGRSGAPRIEGNADGLKCARASIFTGTARQPRTKRSESQAKASLVSGVGAVRCVFSESSQGQCAAIVRPSSLWKCEVESPPSSSSTASEAKGCAAGLACGEARRSRVRCGAHPACDLRSRSCSLPAYQTRFRHPETSDNRTHVKWQRGKRPAVREPRIESILFRPDPPPPAHPRPPVRGRTSQRMRPSQTFVPLVELKSRGR
jgi:hypothetical protein